MIRFIVSNLLAFIVTIIFRILFTWFDYGQKCLDMKIYILYIQGKLPTDTGYNVVDLICLIIFLTMLVNFLVWNDKDEKKSSK